MLIYIFILQYAGLKIFQLKAHPPYDEGLSFVYKLNVMPLEKNETNIYIYVYIYLIIWKNLHRVALIP